MIGWAEASMPAIYFWKNLDLVRTMAGTIHSFFLIDSQPVKGISLNIVNILGSPRKNGTSARIARAFTETATTYGATVSDYPLNIMQYRGCQGCEGCHTRSDRCVLRDDVTAVLDDLYLADIAVFSAPIYFGDTCGQFKSFFDRMWSLIRTDVGDEEENGSRLPPGKVAVLILAHVDAAGAHNDVVERYVLNLELYGFEVRTLIAPGLRLQPNTDIDTQHQDATALARELLRAE
jgi:NAD(P)H-dependent FMN reductase